MGSGSTPGMSPIRLALIGLLARIPRSSGLKRVVRRLRLSKMFPFLINKYYSELSWQTGWAEVFARDPSRVLEYWKKYRSFDEIRDLCGIDKTSRILDVGCGVSTVLHFLEGERYGVDPLATEYKKLYAYPPELNIQRGFGEQLPFSDGFFDVVFCSNVLDHTTAPERTLSEIHRALKPDGHFVLTIEIFDESHERDLSHPHCFTREDVRRLVSPSFEVLFERTSPWIMLRSFVEGTMELEGEQMVLVLKRR